MQQEGSGTDACTTDVLVVGGRCAGAPLATWLARAGVPVVVADRATFPSDTLSTHVFQGGAIASLRRLGVLEDVLATGAPGVRRGRIRIGAGDDVIEEEIPMPAPAPGLPAMLCVRRIALDEILHRTAAEAGAEMLDGWSVKELVREDGRVAGALLRTRGGEERTIRARVVIGADGRNSTLARLVGARSYSVLPTERFGYFAYYEGVPTDDEPVVDIVRDERLYGFGCPTDDGLYLACVMPPADDYAAFAEDVEAGWEREVARLPRVGERVAQGRRAGRPRGLRPVDTFLREAAGPGWALVGDAGHFKDPSPGQGIADALRQAERLATTIAGRGGPAGDGSSGGGPSRGGPSSGGSSGGGSSKGGPSGGGSSKRGPSGGTLGGDAALDERLANYWRWRDRDARGRHEWAHAFGAAGPPPRVLLQAQRDTLARPDGAERFWGPSLQRIAPRKVLGPRQLASAGVRGVASGRLSLGEVAREATALGRRAVAYRRAWRTRGEERSSGPATAAGGAAASGAAAGGTR